ncbi:glycosyltransferase family 8 protein [Bythopirellula polymerisocia]|uniref:glycosyltransferase family 8 protein n=1 Tax=Bythopirellula polymerisocia TaxID=2528003 RepID=UPI0011B36BDF|nr:glycosyltransferase [Bythopirellula polymerisocia]
MDENHQPSPPATTLVYAVDQRNAYAMLISLYSALEKSKGLASVCVLYSGHDQDRVRRLLERTCGAISVRLINAIEELRRLKGKTLPIGTIGDVAYLKFLVPEFVETPRAVFLDADTIVLSDLRDLYQQNLQGRPIGAVQDWLVPTVLCQNSPIREYLNQGDDQPYLNSGVMVMDIERIRCMDLLTAAGKYQGIKVRYSDQDLYNLLLVGNWTVVDPVWNFPIDATLVEVSRRELHGQLWSERKISHYMGTKKPWIFPFNILAANRDFVTCRQRSSLPYWIPTPFSSSSLRYYAGYVRRKFGTEF